MFPSWCSVEGRTNDVLLASHDMSNISQSFLHDDDPMLSWLNRARSSQLEMASVQNMSNVLLRFLVGMVESLMRSLFIILHHFELYGEGENHATLVHS